jgi:glycosyltransferase involved in cell wall biosynthesis
VPASDIPKWLSQCAVGILSIRCDVFLDFAFPNKLPEYIITGKAVIISRLKSIRYYFSDEALAYFQPNDPVDLSRQMVRLYQDPELRKRLTGKAREEYVPIRWDVMKERYLAMVGDLIGARVPALARSRTSAEGAKP